MSEELKPCPFCGSPAMLQTLGDHHGEFHNLGCSVRECPAYDIIYTETDRPVAESIAWWNTRAKTEDKT